LRLRGMPIHQAPHRSGHLGIARREAVERVRVQIIRAHNRDNLRAEALLAIASIPAFRCNTPPTQIAQPHRVGVRILVQALAKLTQHRRVKTFVLRRQV
jgi:hypothetical protein